MELLNLSAIRRWFILPGIVTVFLSLLGCTQKMLAQLDSLRGVRTEKLRDTIRDDPNRRSLMVFVHGFNSSKEAAWGEFPSLVNDDPDFMTFNIHRFGYPTAVCAEVSDIRNQGTFLASYLKSILANHDVKYSQVVLIGHSMGGLAILHALLVLERDDPEVLAETGLKVLTYGTPYFGVENTNALLLLCPNKQVEDMAVLNDSLSHLSREWTQRFNRPAKEGIPNTLRIALYAFNGREDRFVSPMSACGYPQTPCETVDGDHISMVKPKDQRHLSYQKLKQIVARRRIPPTSNGKVGIWVARLTGDDATHSSQREIVASLEYFISREENPFRSMIEVRQLPTRITGHEIKDKEAEAKRLGEEYEASIVVWGEITKLAGVEHVHPRVTLVQPLPISTVTSVLEPIVQGGAQQQAVSNPPDTVRTPPEPIREPLRLGRFLVAISHIQKEQWSEAAGALEKFLAASPAKTIEIVEGYPYAAWVYLKKSQSTGLREDLVRSIELYTKASKFYQDMPDKNNLILPNANLGLAHLTLARLGQDIHVNLMRSKELLQVALDRCQAYANCKFEDRALIRSNLAGVYLTLAEWGSETAQHLHTAIEGLKESITESKQDDVVYALAMNSLGVAYQFMARRGTAPKQNLESAIKAFSETVRVLKGKSNAETDTIVAESNLALSYYLLAQRGENIRANLITSRDKLTEASANVRENKGWIHHAFISNPLGLIYLAMAQNGISREDSLQRGIELFEKAAAFFKEQQIWGFYALAENNIAASYLVRAEQSLSPRPDLNQAVEMLVDSERIWYEQETLPGAALTLNNLGVAYTMLAEVDELAEDNLKKGLAALLKAARLYAKLSDNAGYALTQYNLGGTYYSLWQHEVEPKDSREKSFAAFQNASKLWKEQADWSKYAEAISKLGRGYNALVLRGIEVDENLKLAVETKEEARRLWKDQKTWQNYVSENSALGGIYRRLAERGHSPEQNISNSIHAMSEAVRLLDEEAKWQEYADAQKELGKSYRIGGALDIKPVENFMNSIRPFQEAMRVFDKNKKPVEFAIAWNELSLSYLFLSELPDMSKDYLKSAIEGFEGTVFILQNHSQRGDCAVVRINLAGAYRARAEKGAVSQFDFQRSIETFQESVLVLRDIGQWYHYVEAQVELGKTYEKAASRGMETGTHLAFARHAYEDAINVANERKVDHSLVKFAQSRITEMINP